MYDVTHGYDIGGTLPATGVIYNDSGQTIYILPRDQWEALVTQAREAAQHDEGEAPDGGP